MKRPRSGYDTASASGNEHTTRALMSAGRSLTKKHGITVISEKVGDARTYRIAR
jgi:hypothetical protein